MEFRWIRLIGCHALLIRNFCDFHLQWECCKTKSKRKIQFGWKDSCEKSKMRQSYCSSIAVVNVTRLDAMQRTKLVNSHAEYRIPNLFLFCKRKRCARQLHRYFFWWRNSLNRQNCYFEIRARASELTAQARRIVLFCRRWTNLKFKSSSPCTQHLSIISRFELMTFISLHPFWVINEERDCVMCASNALKYCIRCANIGKKYWTKKNDKNLRVPSNIPIRWNNPSSPYCWVAKLVSLVAVDWFPSSRHLLSMTSTTMTMKFRAMKHSFCEFFLFQQMQ